MLFLKSKGIHSKSNDASGLVSTIKPLALPCSSRQLSIQVFSTGFIYLLMASIGLAVIACEQTTDELTVDPNQNVDRPANAIADSDPLYSCEEIEEQEKIPSTSDNCDPQDGVTLPSLEETEPDNTNQ